MKFSSQSCQLTSPGQRTKLNHEIFGSLDIPSSGPTDPAPSRLTQQSSGLPPIGNTLSYLGETSDGPQLEHTTTSSSVPITPATEIFGNTVPVTRPASATMDDSTPSDEEVMRLKFELAQAQNKISRLDQQLASTRQGQPGLDQPTSISPVNTEFLGGNQSAPTMSRIPGHHAVNVGAQYVGRESQPPWSGYDDNRSDTSDTLSATGFDRSRNIWGGMKQGPSVLSPGGLPAEMPQNGPWIGRAASHGYAESNMSYDPAATSNFRTERLTPDFDLTAKPPGSRRGNRYDTRFSGQGFGGGGQGYSSQPGYGGYPYPPGQYDPGGITSGGSQNGMGTGVYPYHPTPVGTPLSPLASEFTSVSGNAGPWKSEVSGPP